MGGVGHSSSPGLSGSSRQQKKNTGLFALRGEKVKVVGSQRAGVTVIPSDPVLQREAGACLAEETDGSDLEAKPLV